MLHFAFLVPISAMFMGNAYSHKDPNVLSDMLVPFQQLTLQIAVLGGFLESQQSKLVYC